MTKPNDKTIGQNQMTNPNDKAIGQDQMTNQSYCGQSKTSLDKNSFPG